MSLASLATGAVATVASVTVALTSCVPPPSTPSPGSSSPVTVAPSGSPAPTSSTGGPTVHLDLPVYYVGVVRGRPVLYREFRPAVLADGALPHRITEAVTAMLRGNVFDPDYHSSWPASASVRRVEIAGGVAVLDLSDAIVNSIDPAEARATVQQLVWTVTAVAADAGTPVRGVRLLFDGVGVTTLWGSVSVSGTLVRANAVDTLAPVWLIWPQQQAVVGRTFDVHISGAVFEATAQLRVRSASGALVASRVVQLSIGAPSRGEARLSMTLAPGRYTLEAFYFSAADGSVQGLDDHDITVQ